MPDGACASVQVSPPSVEPLITPPKAPVPTDQQFETEGQETPSSAATPIGTATSLQASPPSTVDRKVATSDVPFWPEAMQMPTAGQSMP